MAWVPETTATVKLTLTMTSLLTKQTLTDGAAQTCLRIIKKKKKTDETADTMLMAKILTLISTERSLIF